MLVGEWSHSVFTGSPHIDRLWVIDDAIFRKPDPAGLVVLARKIRKERYDCALLLHRDPKLGQFLAMCGIPVRIGLDLDDDGYWLTDPVRENGVNHETLVYNSLLEPLGIKSTETKMELFYTDAERKIADGLWESAGYISGVPVIGINPGGLIHPGGTFLQRIYPHYYEFAQRIRQEGYQLAYFGGQGDLPVLDHLPVGNGIVSFIGKADLHGSALLMAKCNLVVTHDCGPMHLAAAGGARTISLFAPTDPRREAPLGEGHVYIQAHLPCAPCYQRGKWRKDCTQECIGTITPDSIMIEVKKML